MPYELEDRPTNASQIKPTLVDDVDFNIYIELGDIEVGKAIPPSKFSTRDARLALLQSLWQGNFNADLGLNPVVINYFHSYSTKLANLLLMSEPIPGTGQVNTDEGTPTFQSAQPGERNVLADTAYDALIDMSKHGGAVLAKLDDQILAMNPQNWYPTDYKAHYFIRTFSKGNSVVHNRVELTLIENETATVSIHEYDGDKLGNMIENTTIPNSGVEVVQRDPRNGVWGTSKYIELFSIVVEIARRYSVNSRTLDLYGKPLAVFQDSERDAEARFDIAEDDTQDEAQRKILTGQVGYFENATIHLPDDLTGVDFLQPDTKGVLHSLESIESLTEILRDVSGLPNLQGQTLSGEALKRLFVFFYAETKAIQNSLRLALERILNERVSWEHIFDTDLFSPKPLTEAQNEQDGDEDE